MGLQSLEALIRDAMGGSTTAFHAIFDRLNNKIFAYALSRIGNREDALDIVQEVFVDLWQALKKYTHHSEEEFFGLAFTITKRKISKYYRSKKNNTISLEDSDVIASYKMEPKDFRYLSREIEKLSMIYQEVLRLRYWSDLTFREIAAALQITEGAAKVQHHRAIKQLEIVLKNYEHIHEY